MAVYTSAEELIAAKRRYYKNKRAHAKQLKEWQAERRAWEEQDDLTKRTVTSEWVILESRWGRPLIIAIGLLVITVGGQVNAGMWLAVTTMSGLAIFNLLQQQRGILPLPAFEQRHPMPTFDEEPPTYESPNSPETQGQLEARHIKSLELEETLQAAQSREEQIQIIKKRYRSLAKIYHPDQRDPMLKGGANRWAEITEAYCFFEKALRFGHSKT